MPFDGAGTFARLYSWTQDKLAGIKILAERMDREMDGFAAGLSNCITRDGQSLPTDDIPFNDKRITELGDATSDTDAVNRRTGDARYGLGGRAVTASGASSAYAISTSLGLQSLTDGQVFTFIANHTSTSTTPTLNIDGLGAKAIKGSGGATLPVGAIVSGGVYQATYIAASDHFRLSGSAASGAVAGLTVSSESPTINLQETTAGEYGAFVHVNGNTFYVLRGAANATTWDNGPNGRHPMTMNLTNGDVVFSGNFGAYSDGRLKKNVRPIRGALEKVRRMEGVWFDRIDTGEASAGVVAQKLQRIAPELVQTDQDGFLSVHYPNLVAYLIEAIKELAEGR